MFAYCLSNFLGSLSAKQTILFKKIKKAISNENVKIKYHEGLIEDTSFSVVFDIEDFVLGVDFVYNEKAPGKSKELSQITLFSKLTKNVSDVTEDVFSSAFIKKIAWELKRLKDKEKRQDNIQKAIRKHVKEIVATNESLLNLLKEDSTEFTSTNLYQLIGTSLINKKFQFLKRNRAEKYDFKILFNLSFFDVEITTFFDKGLTLSESSQIILIKNGSRLDITARPECVSLIDEVVNLINQNVFMEEEFYFNETQKKNQEEKERKEKEEEINKLDNQLSQVKSQKIKANNEENIWKNLK